MKKNNMNALAKNGYDVDFVNKQIKITMEFNEQCGDITTDAFKTMMALRAQLPDFKVVETKAGRAASEKKDRVQGLSLEFMRVYIEDMYGEDSKEVRDFEKALELSKSRKSARYAYMKQWFNATYPNAIKLLGGMPDEERRAQQAVLLHAQAKQKLAAAKELQAARAKSNDITDEPAVDQMQSVTRETESELN